MDEPIITIVQGETLRLRVTIRNKRTGAPYPLTGAAITAEIRRTYAAPTALGAFTIEPDNLAEGTFFMVLDEAGSDAIPAGRHIFEVRMELSGGAVKKRPRGQIEVLPSGGTGNG